MASNQNVASFQGLPTPCSVFVSCSTNTGGRPGKLVMCSDVHGCWEDMWRRNCKAVFEASSGGAVYKSSLSANYVFQT